MRLVDFLRDYWQYISAALLVLIDIIIILVKKRPTSKDELNDVIKNCIGKLPYLIRLAEEQNLNGTNKKEYVFENLLTYSETVLGRDFNKVEFKYWFDTLSYFLESMLDLPTKKGGYGREDE